MDASPGVEIIANQLRRETVKPNLAKRVARMMPFLPAQIQLEFDQADRKKRGKKAGRRGVRNRRIIFSEVQKDGRRVEFHATKGLRTYRV